MRVLHLVNWYPSPDNHYEGVWIKRQIESLASHADHDLYHFNIKPNRPFKASVAKKGNLVQTICSVPFNSWRLIEILYFVWLAYQLVVRRIHKRNDIINFHIAYPMLTYWRLLSVIVDKPIVITEHWSAYHFNFNVKNERKLRRIKRIFWQQIPVIAVSRALINDICSFSGKDDFRRYILPNVVDTTVFRLRDTPRGESGSFFMVSQWKWPKDPFTIIRAFFDYEKKRNGVVLRIAGYGDQEKEMMKLVMDLGIQRSVKFLGQLDSDRIAEEMNRADAFLHASEYETFSVVCAEALCCGTPMIIYGQGGIRNLVNRENGILLNGNTVADWAFAFAQFEQTTYERRVIADEASAAFNSRAVGERYYDVLKECVKG